MREAKTEKTVSSGNAAKAAISFDPNEKDKGLFAPSLFSSDLLPSPAKSDASVQETPQAAEDTKNTSPSSESISSEPVLEPTDSAAIPLSDNKVPIEEGAYPIAPQEDPNFQSLVERVGTVAGQQASHGDPNFLAASAQKAAPSPKSEPISQAQVKQVEIMDRQEPGLFDAMAFKQLLLERIRQIIPKNEKEADEFVKSGKLDEVKASAKQKLSTEKTAASGSLESTTHQTPDATSIQPRIPGKLDQPQSVAALSKLDAGKGMPSSRPESQVSTPLLEQSKVLNKQMDEAQLTEEQLGKSNEPQFIDALESTNQVKQNTQTSPIAFRENEQLHLVTTQHDAEQNSLLQFQGIHAHSLGVIAQVAALQTTTGQNDTAERQRIAQYINSIYEKTKSEVEQLLKQLDDSVDQRFEASNQKAQKAFEDHVDRQIKAYKEQRYTGIGGALVWVGDVFTGLPDEVNAFFLEGRQIYLGMMDLELTEIAKYIATQLNEAKHRIAKGKEEVGTFVQDLPQNLRSIGKEAAEQIHSSFSELESNVNNKQEELVNQLAERYRENLEKVDASIEALKATNLGLIGLATNAIAGVAATIFELKNRLLGILQGLAETVLVILTDPIGFLGNLAKGIGQGVINFGSNIFKHLSSGLISWLTGTLGPMGITIPENLFSLSGIFSLVAQILGLGWEFVRKKAVKTLGEPVMKALETSFEFFVILRKQGIIGLWSHLRVAFSDLKETVLGEIQRMVATQVIQAGIKWILGLLSPASAFIKAVMVIIDLVKFFLEKGRQILDLANGFMESILTIASGAVNKVATAIENVLARTLPVLIGFLAALLGVGGLANKVSNLIQKMRDRIEIAVDKLIASIKPTALRFFGKMRKEKKQTKFGMKKPQDSEVGKSIDFSAGGKNRKLYIAHVGNKAKVMLASSPGNELDKALIELEKEAKATENHEVLTLINEAKNISKQTEDKAQDTLKKLFIALRPNASVESLEAAERADEKTEKVEDNLKERLIGILNTFGQKIPPPAQFNPDFPPERSNFFEARFIYKAPNGNRDDGKSGTTNTKGKLNEAFKIIEGFGVKAKWYRFHLLNAQLGGKAEDSNLIPALKFINDDYNKNFEKHLKKHYNNHQPIWFLADLKYIGDTPFVEDYQATGGTLIYKNGDWIEDQKNTVPTYKAKPGWPAKPGEKINISISFLMDGDAIAIDTIIQLTSFTIKALAILRESMPESGYKNKDELKAAIMKSDIRAKKPVIDAIDKIEINFDK